MTTSTSSTTTTTLGAVCAPLVTFDATLCRLRGLGDAVAALDLPERAQGRLLGRLDRATTRTTDAGALCTGGRLRAARERLRAASRQMAAVARGLDAPALRGVPAEHRGALRVEARSLRDDLGRLRRDLAC